jgi:nitroreductase
MHTIDAIKGRTSVRDYKSEPVPEDVLESILEAAVHAPSSGNVQDWHFVVVKTPEGRNALAAAAFNQGFVAKAPVVIVVCTDLGMITKAYGDRGRSLYSIQNTSAAIQNLMLAAWDKGLGTCWIGAFNEDEVKSAAVLPREVRPLALITLGYPAGKSVKSRRKSVNDVLHWETF